MRPSLRGERPVEIRDPVHGFIKVRGPELEIIDTPSFQRLRRIRQLACAFMAYPGANHTRFEHSVGTMYVAGLCAGVLVDKGYVDEDVAAELRLAALLHDVGHGPFSHVYEELLYEKRGLTHEDLGSRMIRGSELGDVLRKHGHSPRGMAALAIGRALGSRKYMNEVVAGTLSADIMDYLLRDSYYTGAGFGRVDIMRVIDSFEMVDGQLGIESDALHSFEALTVARYEMFKAVYFHKTARAGESMVLKAMAFADEALGLTDVGDLERYRRLDDEYVVNAILSLKEDEEEAAVKARKLIRDYLDRRLIKCVYEKMVLRREGFAESLLMKPSVRAEVAGEIAEVAKVDPDVIYVDVPTAPSVPFTSDRERLVELNVVSKGATGVKKTKLSLNDIPALAAISGFMDIIRVYTHQEYREAVEKAVTKVLGESGYTTKISV